MTIDPNISDEELSAPSSRTEAVTYVIDTDENYEAFLDSEAEYEAERCSYGL